MTNLLIEFYKNLDECKQLREDLEKVKILLNNVSSDKNKEEIQNLQIQLGDLKEKLSIKNDECESLQLKLNEITQSNEAQINLELEQLKSELENSVEQSSKKDHLITTLQDTIDVLTNERDRYESEVQNQMRLVSDLRTEFDQLCADVKVNNQRLNEKSTELDQLQHEFDMRLKTSTNEVEILKTLVAEQKQLLIDAYQEHELDINQKLKEIVDYENQVKQLTQELEALKKANAVNQESQVEDLKVEIKKLKDLWNESNREIETQKEALLHKQETIDTLNTQIIELYKSMEENANKVIEKEDEMQYLQEIVDSNREEIRKTHDKLTTADKTIDDLRTQLMNKVHEIELLQQKTIASPVAHDNKSDEKIKQLEAEIKALDTKNKEQHDKLKKYAANLKKKQAQCTELEEKLSASSSVDTIDSSVVNELKAKVVQYEEQLNLIKVENSKLNESIQKSSVNDEIEDLRWKIDEYESIVNDKSKEIDNLQNQLQQLTDKCDQMEESTFNLQLQIQKLENERDILKENLDRYAHEMSSIKQEKEELANKLLDSGDKAEEKKKMEKLKAAAVQLKHKLADKKKEVESLQAEIEILKSTPPPTNNSEEVESLKKQIKELDEMNEKILSETKVAYDNDIGLLRQKIEELDSTNRLLIEEKQRKVSLEGQLETFEMTNIELREKVARLEEAVASLDAEKNSLIREKLSLDKELEEKDELIGRKLRETEAENLQLNETIKALNEERNEFLQKMSTIQVQLSAEMERSSLQLSNYENDNSQLQQQIQNLQADIKKHQTSYEQALATKHAEIDEMEGQFSSQLQKVESEKKSIQESLEKANDQIVDYQDEIIRLRDNVHSLEQARSDLERELSWLNLQNENYTQDQLEIEQLRMQLMQNETELENLRSQNESLISNHDAEVLILRQQIADLEAMRSQVSQNQTDDQVMLQNENVKLKELLIEKESVIQQKAMQLQMATMFEAPVQAVNDPFSSLQAPPQQASTSVDHNELKSLQDRLKQANDEMEKLRESQMMTNMELDMQSGKIQELMNENRKLQEKANEMQSMMDNLIRTNVDLEAVTERQKNDIEMKDREINEIKNEMCALRDHHNQSTQSTDDDKLHPELHSLQNELIEKNRAIENLQSILQKYESQPVSRMTQQPTAVITPQPFSTSMFFNDPQPSTSSLFDDPFNLAPSTPQPVVEDVIMPKKAYVYNEQKNSSTEVQTDERWLIEHQENFNTILQLQNQLQSMEQRIMEQYMELETQRQRIVELEANQKQQQEVVPQVEPECVAKKAYLCYDNSQTVETQTDFDLFSEYQARISQLEAQLNSMQQSLQPVIEVVETPKVQTQQLASTASFFDSPVDALEIEDTWGGWGSENASAIQEFVPPQQTSLLSPRSDLEVRLQEQRDIVERLEKEKNALNEELLNLRENSKKMMKKLKEYQQKIKDMEANKRRSSSFDNEMDLVIQEELKSQIQKLENRLKEINSEREKEQHEREALNKKIEVLSNANDRMIEMKERQDSQIDMYQLKIKDLNQKLQNLEEWGSEEKKETVHNVSSATAVNNDELNKKIKELSDQLKDLAVDNEELQALLDEEKSNNKILEEKLSKINSEQSFNEASKDDEIQRLSQQLSFSHAQCEALNHQITSKNHEIQELVSKIDQLSQDSVNIRGFLDDLRSQVQQKTDENQALNDRLQKLEVNKDELSHERQLYNQSIEQQYQQQIQDFELRLQSLHGEMEYKTAEVSILTEKNQELMKDISQIKSELNSKENEILSLQAKVNDVAVSLPSSNSDLNAKLTQLEKINDELLKEKSLMEHELQVLNDQVLASLEFEDRMKNTVLELDAKNMEIQMLKTTIENIQSQPQVQQSADYSDEIEKLKSEKEDLERKMQSQIDILNAQWSQMVEQRGNEVANSWKQHLEMRESEFAEIEANLRASLQQQSQENVNEDKSTENNDTILKMKSIMESQEVEIVSLKEQLAIRSAEYASLSARVDPYHQMSSSMSVSPIPSVDTDKVPRSELDLALYMLHQRDMRLEEITMELVRLLEERDTLQLRLSNAIRQIEEFKKKFNIETAESSDQSTPEKQPSKIEDEQLKAKLSELNTIKHLRDKDIADEREKRFAEHMSLFQRDIANIPSEAAARIVSSGSDQNQSPSNVLMNWILGNKSGTS
ncbi:hypothetical protein PVAND_012402 [Polypedilum vanderplanki]|uniref:Uncharacterized protein n=1 Tax=Polypedilum vanderplanki TaxID=319348 RepID=A0A9J6CNA0_POLVA|nr:hypothetical protein PVAND_012402 [Polypedilum vanderplanki]